MGPWAVIGLCIRSLSGKLSGDHREMHLRWWSADGKLTFCRGFSLSNFCISEQLLASEKLLPATHFLPHIVLCMLLLTMFTAVTSSGSVGGGVDGPLTRCDLTGLRLLVKHINCIYSSCCKTFTSLLHRF